MRCSRSFRRTAYVAPSMPPLEAGRGVDGPATVGAIGEGVVAAEAAGGGAPADAAGAADADAAAAAGFFAAFPPACPSTVGRPKDAATSNGAIRSMGTK